MKIKEENYFWCKQCHHVSYRFDCCGNTACNGGGCDQCKDNRENLDWILNHLPTDVDEGIIENGIQRLQNM